MEILVQSPSYEVREEWTRLAPPEWERRLREISPIVDKTSHLRFRWRGDTEQWELYECVPAHLLTPGRITQLSTHWSALPKTEQMGRKRFVTEYQFWMFHTHRVEARRFWVLQGSTFIVGGTPYSFTERERRVLEASNEEAEPIPPGTLPNIPFDERVVSAILARDNLIKLGGSLDALEKANRPESLRAADEETDRLYRKAFLDWHHTQNAPSAEFMKWYGGRKEAQTTLRPAPEGLANALADWRDRYVEDGTVGGGVPNSRVIQVAVR